jgi:hypothetical protein
MATLLLPQVTLVEQLGSLQKHSTAGDANEQVRHAVLRYRYTLSQLSPLEVSGGLARAQACCAVLCCGAAKHVSAGINWDLCVVLRRPVPQEARRVAFFLYHNLRASRRRNWVQQSGAGGGCRWLNGGGGRRGGRERGCRTCVGESRGGAAEASARRI